MLQVRLRLSFWFLVGTGGAGKSSPPSRPPDFWPDFWPVFLAPKYSVAASTGAKNTVLQALHGRENTALHVLRWDLLNFMCPFVSFSFLGNSFLTGLFAISGFVGKASGWCFGGFYFVFRTVFGQIEFSGKNNWTSV